MSDTQPHTEEGHLVRVSFTIPRPLKRLLDTVVQEEDTDRSKLIRQALRDRISRQASAKKVTT